MRKYPFRYRAVQHPDRKNLFAIQCTQEPEGCADSAWLYVTTRSVTARHQSGYKVKEYNTFEKANLDAKMRTEDVAGL